jgi:cephalosporin hydroxylase
MLSINEIWQKAVEQKIQQKEAEFVRLLEILKTASVSSIMEIGCYDGGTTVAFSHMANKLFTIDLQRRFNNSIVNPSTDFYFIEGDSHNPDVIEKVGELIIEPVDFLFIDGDHTAEGCLFDFLTFKGLVKSDGIIAFHDIVDSPMHRSLNCTVADTWNKLKDEYTHEEIITDPLEWGGIGLIFL